MFEKTAPIAPAVATPGPEHGAKVPPAWLFYLLLAVLAGALLFCATPYGLMVFSGDSIAYIEGARSIREGHGYSVQIPPGPRTWTVVFPPLYSITIAAVSVLVHDPYAAARWLSVVSFALSVFLLCLLVWRVTAGSLWGGLAAGLLCAGNPVLIGVFAKGFSETIFIPLGLAGQLALVEFASSRKRGWLLAAALVLGLSAVARYSGVVWIGSAVCALLFCAGENLRERAGNLATFLAVVIVPSIILAIRNRLISARVAGRSWVLHPISQAHFREGLETVSTWFLPWRFHGLPAGVAVLAVLALLTAGGLRASLRKPAAAMFWTMGALFTLFYLAHLPVAISLVGYDTAINDRILAPVEIWMIAAACAWMAGARGDWLRPAVRGAVALVLLLSVAGSIGMVKKCRLSSGGYAGPMYRANPMYQRLRDLPEGAAIYSNKPEAVYLSAQRPVRTIPLKNDPMNLTPNQDASAELAEMMRDLKANHGVIFYVLPVSTDVLYNGAAPLTRLHEFTDTELKAMLNLDTAAAGGDSEILKPKAE